MTEDVQNTVGPWRWIAALGAALCGAAMAMPPVAARTVWTEVTADISIRQMLVDGAGHPMHTAPPALAFRMLRTFGSTGWRTTLTLVQQELPKTALPGEQPAALNNPFAIARIEYDGDGTLPRLYNPSGQQVVGPNALNRALLATPQSIATSADWDARKRQFTASVVSATSSAWVDDLVATPDKRNERRQAIERTYGKPKKRVNGLDRYVTTDGALTAELLVKPDAVVPVELNQVDGGELVGRVLSTYLIRNDGAYIKRLHHAERKMPAIAGARSIIDVETTNVVTRAGGVQ
jgi:hypothetical protein